MPLNVTPVNRNLQTRVTFMCLEFEDLFVVLGIAALTNVAGHFVSGDLAGLPMSIVVQYGVPLSIVRRRSGNYWAKCPSCAQQGRDRSGDNLAICVTDPRKYKCWAGCTKEMIRAALGCPIRTRIAS